MSTVQTLSVDSLLDELKTHPVNTNQFFITFRDRFLTHQELQTFIRQYHYFCHRFVKVLEGLLYHTPLEELEMRIELVKTLYSELGSGSTEHVHIRQLERFAEAIDLQKIDLRQTQPIPEVRSYLEALNRLFVKSGYLSALGAELAVETTAASEFQYFLPGLQKYNRFSARDLTFFALHLEEEMQHSTWLADAVRKTAKTTEEMDQVATSARETADAWYEFWMGMYRAVFQTPQPS